MLHPPSRAASYPVISPLIFKVYRHNKRHMINHPDIIQQLEALMESMCFNAIDIAEQYCDPKQGEPACAHYHGIRFLLHKLGARTTLPCQYEVFYSDLINLIAKENLAGKTLRVLISGTADFVVPALVSSAIKESGVAAEVTIVDRCRTPLQFCREAARQFGFTWRYHQSDITNLEFEQRFDLIVTDRLIGHIPPQFRPRIFNKWATLLATEGKLITMVSLRPNGKSSLEEKQALLRKLEDTEAKYQAEHNYPSQILAQMIASYASTRSGYPIADVPSLKTMMSNSQLKIVSLGPVKTAHHSIKGKDPFSLVKLIAQRR